MALPTILERIATERREDVAAARSVKPLETLRREAEAVPAPEGRFAASLAEPGVSVIAEVKRASPSRGRMADIPDPAALAKRYADGGARAVSVLTEPRHFLGSQNDLLAVARDSGLPVLRKDFIVEPYQVWEARLWGASACLLIVALLDRVDTLRRMLDACDEAGLDALVEVHDAAELETALKAGSRIVGVNHRNLHTFEVDTSLFGRLVASMGQGVIKVAESGIHDAATVRRLAGEGADAVLVGERVSSAPDPAVAVRELLGGVA